VDLWKLNIELYFTPSCRLLRTVNAQSSFRQFTRGKHRKHQLTFIRGCIMYRQIGSGCWWWTFQFLTLCLQVTTKICSANVSINMAFLALAWHTDSSWQVLVKWLQIVWKGHGQCFTWPFWILVPSLLWNGKVTTDPKLVMKWEIWDGCIVWNAHNTVFGLKRSAVCALALYLVHSTRPKIQGLMLRLSSRSSVCHCLGERVSD